MRMQYIALILATSVTCMHARAEQNRDPIDLVPNRTHTTQLFNETVLSFEFDSGCFRIQDGGLDEEIYTFSYPIIAYTDAQDNKLLVFGLKNGTVHIVRYWRNEGGKTMIDNHAIIFPRRSQTCEKSGMPVFAIEFLEGNNSLRVRYALLDTDMNDITETATVVYRLPTCEIVSEAFCISPPMHRPNWLETPQ